ncbi:DNA-binding response regulator [Stenotrophomonas sp. ESTM1D_MKCIP4_1]|uniref:response regulator n=1 Tax=Stenotrophomonas sp. ESTM1D_MKCIP4_1 TaxID=2072414 RepID=UPI000D53E5BE|nr:response regulator transcription factor [Stenotrophomonas sp. ESTM1D_MKCIP4_1]AWH55082.1 DNA-binding response regulator [Stenotrophomonas sp. ESTM1D_MKCIP4_1]
MDENIRVLIIDDHPLMRDGIRTLLSQEQGMVVVGEAGDGIEGLEALKRFHPNVVLVDFQMPVMNGAEFCRAARELDPAVALIMLTTYRGDVQVMQAFSSGVRGYILKDMLKADLVSTIKTVHQGKRVVAPDLALELATHIHDQRLSKREIEILRMVADGNSNKEIARHCGLTETTVKSHMKSIMSKLGAKDRTHAVTIAVKRGIFLL